MRSKEISACVAGTPPRTARFKARASPLNFRGCSVKRSWQGLQAAYRRFICKLGRRAASLRPLRTVTSGLTWLRVPFAASFETAGCKASHARTDARALIKVLAGPLEADSGCSGDARCSAHLAMVPVRAVSNVLELRVVPAAEGRLGLLASQWGEHVHGRFGLVARQRFSVCELRHGELDFLDGEPRRVL